MILLTHIFIALASIGFTAATVWSPNSEKLRVSTALTGLTVASGTILVIVSHSPLLQACMTGLCYLAVMFAAIGASYYRLHKADQ